jgi:hypothetical protein
MDRKTERTWVNGKSIEERRGVNGRSRKELLSFSFLGDLVDYITRVEYGCMARYHSW